MYLYLYLYKKVFPMHECFWESMTTLEGFEGHHLFEKSKPPEITELSNMKW